MNISFFWLGNFTNEIELAVRYLSGAGKIGNSHKFQFFADHDSENISPFTRDIRKYPYNTINDLQDAFKHAKANDSDFAVISFGNGFSTSISRLTNLLMSDKIQESIWSFRICMMTGVGFRHWPRIPNIDDHFIILNIRKAIESKFFERKLIHSSHFGEVGLRHSHLMSMIEYSVEKSEIANHFVPDSSRDQYGRICRFDSMPFHMCESSGFMCCYSQFNQDFINLFKGNYERGLGHEILPKHSLRYIQTGEFLYFRQLLPARQIVDRLKRPFSIAKFEFQKEFKDEN